LHHAVQLEERTMASVWIESEAGVLAALSIEKVEATKEDHR
jgi:hypothetical protein